MKSGCEESTEQGNRVEGGTQGAVNEGTPSGDPGDGAEYGCDEDAAAGVRAVSHSDKTQHCDGGNRACPPGHPCCFYDDAVLPSDTSSLTRGCPRRQRASAPKSVPHQNQISRISRLPWIYILPISNFARILHITNIHDHHPLPYFSHISPV